MGQIKHHKVVSALPIPLEADSIYYVRSGTGFDLYVTNSSGTIVAYPLNGKPLYESAELTLTASGSFNLTHSLGVPPKIIVGSYICIEAEGGYSAGDIVYDPIAYIYTDAGVVISASASFTSTQIRIRFSAYLRVPNKATGAIFNITPAKWRYLVRAFA